MVANWKLTGWVAEDDHVAHVRILGLQSAGGTVQVHNAALQLSPLAAGTRATAGDCICGFLLAD